MSICMCTHTKGHGCCGCCEDPRRLSSWKPKDVLSDETRTALRDALPATARDEEGDRG